MENGESTGATALRSVAVPAKTGCSQIRDRLSRLSARCLFHVSLAARRWSAVHQGSDLGRTTVKSQYRSWRYRELEAQLTRHFDVAELVGIDVLDFGCGTGELCHIMAPNKPKSITGIDCSKDAIERARNGSRTREGVAKPVFVCNADAGEIPLPDSCMDLICCFDAVEHIAHPGAVFREWSRVLRPGGRVWIWWSPWRGPFGHHLESLIPVPWIHLLVPERVLFHASADMYDDPSYVPRHWDLDPNTGCKKPNKWRSTTSFHPFLNKLTRRQFECLVKSAGLIIRRREVHGFGGSPLRRATRALLPVPGLGDCVVSFYVYVLEKSC